MTSRSAATRREAYRRAVADAAAVQQRRTRRRQLIVTAAVLGALGVIVTAMMLSSRSTSGSTNRTAPGFTLTDTAGEQVSLASFRGRNVLLFFSEGAGCGSCLQQMAAIEKDRGAFDQLGVTVLPIVMNSRAQITADMRQYGVTTPFLLDDGQVARAYGVLGKGMHAGLPGHSFVLVDPTGRQRWMGEYPSMWLAPTELLSRVRDHLSNGSDGAG